MNPVQGRVIFANMFTLPLYIISPLISLSGVLMRN